MESSDTENHLTRINATLARVLEVTSDAALHLDCQGTVLAANDKLAEQLGVERQELVGRNFYDFFPQEEAERQRNVLNLVLTSKASLRYEDDSRPGVTYDTRFLPVLDENKDVASVVVCITNVSDSRKGERERIQLRSAIEQAMEAFIITDENLVIQFVNQAFEDMTGYSQNEAIGNSIDMLYVGKKQQDLFLRIVDRLNRGEVWTGKTPNTRKDGRIIHCDKTVTPVRGKFGVILGYVSVWRDVTQVSTLRKQLRHAQKMEAIGTLAGGIAHDFNNIMGPIMLHAEMGLEMAQEGPLRESLEQILEAVKRAKALVDQILSISRLDERDAPIPFRLSSIVKECCKLLQPSLPTSIRVRHEVATDQDVILADPSQVHQLIMNLCTNAAQAMAEAGGDLHLEVRELMVNEYNFSEHPQVEPGNYVVLSVTDTGCGIVPENMDKIFDPFFTTKSARMGTGLGLAVVQSIITRLKGGIVVDSQPGQGTQVTVLLPKEDGPPLEMVEHLETDMRAKEGEHLLLVDDEEALVKAARRMLEGLGYKVTTALSGTEALALFGERPRDFDLVVTDMTMPDMTGLALAKKLLNLRKDLPLVLTSGYADATTSMERRELGVGDFVMKPYQRDDLGSAVRRLLDATRRRSAASRSRNGQPKATRQRTSGGRKGGR